MSTLLGTFFNTSKKKDLFFISPRLDWSGMCWANLLLDQFGINNIMFSQCNMQEGLEGNPVAGTMKNVSRGLAVLTVPFTMSFPKVILLLFSFSRKL